MSCNYTQVSFPSNPARQGLVCLLCLIAPSGGSARVPGLCAVHHCKPRVWIVEVLKGCTD